MIPVPPNVIASLIFRPTAFGWPGGLAVVVGLAAVVFAYTAGLRWRQYSRLTRVSLLSLRAGAILCLLLALVHPAWVSQRTVEEKPVVAVVLDDSESMTRPAAAGEASEDAPSRYARALELLHQHIRTNLQETHQVRLFDVEGRAVDSDDLPEAPAGARSPLTNTLLRVQRDLSRQPLIGVVLLSDGAETIDRPAIGGLEQLRVPVFPVEIADESTNTSDPPNLAIRAVSANRRALVNNTVRVAVDLTATGRVEAANVPVTIRDGGRTVATRTIQLRPGAPAMRVELDFIPRRPGEFTHTVQVGSLPGETDLADNRETFPLSVRAKPLTVLYIDGVLRWEGKFIRQALAADPDINLVSSVRTVRPGADRGSQGLLLAEQLANIDVVILGDVEASYFAANEIDSLRSWVIDSGGGLVLTGGYDGFGPKGFGRTDLSGILPAEFSAAASPQIEQPFAFKLTDAGREHPIFHLTGDPMRDTAFYQSLPQLLGCCRLAAVKPGAQVLAVNPQVIGPGGAQGLPVMMVQQVGRGRTMVFAVDTTWRWRMVVGGYAGDHSFYQRFWGQLVRWLATVQGQVPPQLLVSTDRYRYKPGQTIKLTVELGPSQSNPSGNDTDPDAAAAGVVNPARWRVTARAVDESGGQMNIPLADLGGAKYRATLAAPRPGRLDLTVTAEADLAAPGASDNANHTQANALSQVTTVQVDPPDLEMLDPRPDPQWLAQVAQMSGGRSIKPDQIAAWAQQLPHESIQRAALETTRLLGDKLLATVFLVLLCAEWILRRKNRLA